jgi:excisionase family DNA binding protein
LRVKRPTESNEQKRAKEDRGMTAVMPRSDGAAEALGSGMKERRSPRNDPQVPEESPFLVRREVARLFGVSPSTVTRWARLGLLKAARTRGGHYRFPAEETRRAAGRASDSVPPQKV